MFDFDDIEDKYEIVARIIVMDFPTTKEVMCISRVELLSLLDRKHTSEPMFFRIGASLRKFDFKISKPAANRPDYLITRCGYSVSEFSF